MGILNLTRYEYLAKRIDSITNQIEIDSNILSIALKEKFYVFDRMNTDFSKDFSIRDYSFGDKKLRVLVLDKNNLVVLDDQKTIFGEKIDLELIDNSKTENKTLSKYYLNRKKKDLLFVSSPIVRDDDYVGSVLVIKDISDIIKDVNFIENRIIIVTLPLIIIFGFLIFLYFINSLLPLEKVSEGVAQVTRGKYGYKIEDIGSYDLNQIVKSFNLMSERLNEIEKQQSTFISNLSHELKTPITSIKILADSLIDSGLKISKEELKEFLGDISSESERLKDLIDELLYIAKLEKRDLSLNLVYSGINKPINAAIASLKGYAKKNNIIIKYFDQNRIKAEYDYNKMVQVFVNVIGNAIKYNRPNGYVKITQKYNKRFVEIHIVDNGIGIPSKDLKYIFDRFYRVSSSRARDDVGGTGLGSSISKDIIQLHGGSIEIESVEGKGTDVTILIPRRFEVQAWRN